ncbi:hypothetical protein GUJ93_ZPchr0007g3348 [Zizania palustris]|uniref:Uncharacterized protein n=1 Tax=Zizania palustris TaxID=103762 RepID=A0A8J5VXW3_ZIZPA|nr:hypothetical protein GUJ93_ZPchr0007g3348 [Zizania palustris]
MREKTNVIRLDLQAARELAGGNSAQLVRVGVTMSQRTAGNAWRWRAVKPAMSLRAAAGAAGDDESVTPGAGYC